MTDPGPRGADRACGAGADERTAPAALPIPAPAPIDPPFTTPRA